MSLYLRQLSLGPMENFVYLVGDTDVKKCVIVDPAWEIDTAVAAAEKDGFIVEGALLTHAHFDHCNAVDVLLAKRNMPIYVNPLELDYLDKGAPRGLFLDLPKESMKPVQGGGHPEVGDDRNHFPPYPGAHAGVSMFFGERKPHVGRHPVSGVLWTLRFAGIQSERFVHQPK